MGLSKQFFLWLAEQENLKEFLLQFEPARRFAHRFVAGDSRKEAFDAARSLQREGMEVTLDHLGEDVQEPETAEQAARHYIDLLDAIADRNLGASISIKLSQLGIAFNYDLCKQHVEIILETAREHDLIVEIDMEGSRYTDDTLALFKEVRDEFDNVGVCVQAYLYRTEEDLKQLLDTESPIRLCKGAYDESKDVAFPRKKQVDENFAHLLGYLLEEENAQENMPLIATHDEDLIALAKTFAKANNIAKDEFAFEMLYGIRDDLKEELVKEGYTVRVYIPYGEEWYPYFMRRLAERPANIMFFLKHAL